jgi:hypothetical protein
VVHRKLVYIVRPEDHAENDVNRII